MNDVSLTIQNRTSVNIFLKDRPLSDNQIRDLVRVSQEAPSSFNIQHTRIIAVTDSDLKTQLREAAYGQEKISMSSATLVFLGDIEAYKSLARTLEPSINQGILDAETVKTWVDMANGMYGGNAQMARDEAIRSASLSAMTLMIDAKARGLDTGPMIGFDPDKVRRVLNVSERYIPVMLVTLGFAAAGNWKRKPRLPLDAVFGHNTNHPFH